MLRRVLHYVLNVCVRDIRHGIPNEAAHRLLEIRGKCLFALPASPELQGRHIYALSVEPRGPARSQRRGRHLQGAEACFHLHRLPGFHEAFARRSPERRVRLEVADRFDFDRFSLIYLRNAANDFEVELTVNRGTTRPYDLGNGYGHMAFAVDDLAGERERVAGLGYEPGEIKELQRDGKMLARYFFIDDPDGYKIEMLERHGRYR